MHDWSQSFYGMLQALRKKESMAASPQLNTSVDLYHKL